MAAEKGLSRKDALAGAGLSAGALLFGAGVLTPGVANAEFTPSQRKQQYFRYAPRIKSESCVWMCLWGGMGRAGRGGSCLFGVHHGSD